MRPHAMTYPMGNPTATAPWACAQKMSCMGIESSLRIRTQELAEVRVRLADAVEQVDALAAQLAVKTSNVELVKINERIAAYQAIDMAQRRDLDRLADENYHLRQIMKTGKIDFEAVDAILAPVLARHDILEARTES